MTLLELYGWLGAGLLLLGFALNIFRKIDANSYSYLLLNLIGSSLLLYNAWENGAFPFVTINAVWVIFSSYTLIRKQTVSTQR
ncbi:MAG: hypothetical protein ACI8QD_001517 [Cyclobacteriaceae bacterium]|jgi:hypothetical protein